MTPLASVVIPVRNEEADIVGCLEAVAAQDVGVDALEVIVADGRSTDRTKAVLDEVGPSLGFSRFVVVENPRQGIAAGLNVALANAKSSVVVRVDARSRIEPHYVRTVVDVLGTRDDVGVVGGAQVPIDRGVGPMSAGIARALANRYSTGLSRYRSGSTSGPSDTVWMGAFRTEELRGFGGWDESLVVNEDYELCERYLAADRLVWFDVSLRSGYLTRPDLASVGRQYFAYGWTKGQRWKHGASVRPRQAVLLAVPPVGLGSSVMLARRLGPLPTGALGVGALLAVDELGSEVRAGLGVRLASVTATMTIGGAWWTGVIIGLLGRPEEE